jgi:hypothetical protein
MEKKICNTLFLRTSKVFGVLKSAVSPLMAAHPLSMKGISNNWTLLDNRMYFKYVHHKLRDCSRAKLSLFLLQTRLIVMSLLSKIYIEVSEYGCNDLCFVYCYSLTEDYIIRTHNGLFSLSLSLSLSLFVTILIYYFLEGVRVDVGVGMGVVCVCG